MHLFVQKPTEDNGVFVADARTNKSPQQWLNLKGAVTLGLPRVLPIAEHACGLQGSRDDPLENVHTHAIPNRMSHAALGHEEEPSEHVVRRNSLKPQHFWYRHPSPLGGNVEAPLCRT